MMEIDLIPLSQLPSRYGIARSNLYNRLKDLKIESFHISKTGSSHLVLIYATSLKPVIEVEALTRYRKTIYENIGANFPNSEVEIVFRD